MTFEHNGVRYRIGFKHDKSRRWEDHFNHEVRLVRKVNPVIHGPAQLYCVQCELSLSHLERPQRVRNTHCTIWIQNGTRIAEDTGKEYPVWDEVAQAHGHLNLAAGDHYDREKGRVAALRAALEQSDPLVVGGIEFRAALWQWFLHGRKRSAVERSAAAKGGR